MPRPGPFIHQVHIADGFADDCDELIHRCLKCDSRLNFAVFSSIWKEMKFGALYSGRILGAEIAELSEEVIHIAKHYMLKNTSNFEESVAGLFIVYGLLTMQPYPGFAALRIVPEDLPAIQRIDMVARRDKRMDVLYVLGSILIKGPVQYHAAERERGMELALRKNLEGYTSIDKLGLRPKGVFYRQNEELDILKEIGTISQRYTQAKKTISQKQNLDRNLQYINENLATEMQDSLKKIISGIIENEPSAYKEIANKQLNRRRAIKDRAMRQNVNAVRHLNTSDDKDEDIKEPVSPQKDNTAQCSKDKDPSKTVTLQDQVRHSKRKIPFSPRVSAKRSRSCSDTDDETSSSDTDFEEELRKLDKLYEAEDKNNDTQKSSQEDEPRDEQQAKAAESTQNEEQEVILNINDLPILIESEDPNKYIAFQISDLGTINSKQTEAETTDGPVKPLKKLRMASKKRNNTSKKEAQPAMVPVPGTSKDFNPGWELFNDDNGPRIRKNANKPLKRVHLHSKMKRMGILSIGNFNHSEIGDKFNGNPTTKDQKHNTRKANNKKTTK